MTRRQQPAGVGLQSVELHHQLGAILRRQILLGKVDIRLNPGQHSENPVYERGEMAPQRPAQLLIRGGERPFTPCVDQVHHGLGLAQIHPPIEKRPLGEFPGLRHPAPARQKILEDLLGDVGIPVTRNFQDILPSVGVGPGEKREERVVQQRTREIAIVAVVSHAGQGSSPAAEVRGDFLSCRPAHPHQRDRRRPDGRRQSANGVGSPKHAREPTRRATGCQTKSPGRISGPRPAPFYFFAAALGSPVGGGA